MARDKGRPREQRVLHNLIHTKLRICASWWVQEIQQKSKQTQNQKRKCQSLHGAQCTQGVPTSCNFQRVLSDGFPKARLFLWLKKRETNYCNTSPLKWKAKALMRKPPWSSSQGLKAWHWCLQACHSWDGWTPRPEDWCRWLGSSPTVPTKGQPAVLPIEASANTYYWLTPVQARSVFTCYRAAQAPAGQYRDGFELIPHQAQVIILIACEELFYLGP